MRPRAKRSIPYEQAGSLGGLVVTTTIEGALLGLVLGLRHTLEPDHLAAVGTFVSGARRPAHAAAVGARWGIGHAAGILALGGLVLSLRRAIPGWLDAGLELAVGLVLVGLGIRALRTARLRLMQSHADHGKLGPFAVGVGHGLAGTGAAVVLATAAMPNAASGALFLAVFGAGSVMGMAGIAALVSLPLGRLSLRPAWHVRVSQLTGLLSILIGLWWLVSPSGALLSPH